MADLNEELEPLVCEQCGEPIWPSDETVSLADIDPERGEPMDAPGRVVHADCHAEWERSQRSE